MTCYTATDRRNNTLKNWMGQYTKLDGLQKLGRSNTKLGGPVHGRPTLGTTTASS